MASFSELVSIADIEMLRMTVGGEKLGPEMLVLLSLISCDGYLLFPNASERAELDRWLAGRFCS